MKSKHYRDQLTVLLTEQFLPAGYKITMAVQLDPVPKNAKYDALNFSLDGRNIAYRRANVTADRPGAFLAFWQRPPQLSAAVVQSPNSNKPIPFKSDEIDYLFVQVANHSEQSISRQSSDKEPSDKQLSNKQAAHTALSGMFIFPVSVLIEKGIVSSVNAKGKTGFRVFPPWSEDRGEKGTQVFSASGKKTQRWQLPYFLTIDDTGFIDTAKLKAILGYNPD